MQGIHRVQKDGHQADGGEGGGDFARHDPTFSNSRDHELGAGRGAAIKQLQGGFHLLAIQTVGTGGDCRRLLLQAARQSGQREAPG